MTECERVVILVDMDCFYVQVEQRRQPCIKGLPCAVVQYNKWKGGGIIAVSYEARAKGVSRNMRGDDAKEKCPEIVLCMVPTANGKADLTRYRNAGAEVIQVLLQFGGIVERASIDEAYIDLTEVVNQKIESFQSTSCDSPSLHELKHTYVVGYPQAPADSSDQTDVQIAGLTEYQGQVGKDKNVLRLLIAAAIVEEMRLAIFEQTTFRCSAGISHNKVLAKLACGINKPNKQTVLPMDSVSSLFNQVKIEKIRNLGGKLGQQLSQNLGIEYIGQLTKVTKSALIEIHGVKTGEWLYEICRGIDHEPVKERHVAQSVGCSKTFRGIEALNTRTKVNHWIGCLATELVERLIRDREINNRTSKSLTVHIGFNQQKSLSRTCHISQYTVEDISRNIMTTLELLNQSKDRQDDVWFPAITMIGVSAGKFLNACDKSQTKLKTMKSIKKSSDMPYPSTSEILNSAMTRSPIKYEKLDPKSEFPSASPQVPNCTEAENFEPRLANALPKLTPSPRKTELSEKSTMEKKRLFFTQNFGVAKSKPLVKLTSPEKVSDTSKRKASAASATEKKISFFAKMREIAAQEKPSCKIDSAFEELTNIKDSKNERVQGNVSENNETGDTELNSISSSSPTKTKQATKEAITYLTPTMDDIDMEVFNSLPLYLQHEIKITSRRSDSAANTTGNDVGSKRQRLEHSSGQASIAGFFNGSLSQDRTKSSPKKFITKKNKTKTRKGSLQFKYLEENAVPLGFFRARSQASAAIRDAVEKQALLSQKRKADELKNDSSVQN